MDQQLKDFLKNQHLKFEQELNLILQKRNVKMFRSNLCIAFYPNDNNEFDFYNDKDEKITLNSIEEEEKNIIYRNKKIEDNDVLSIKFKNFVKFFIYNESVGKGVKFYYLNGDINLVNNLPRIASLSNHFKDIYLIEVLIN